MDGAYIINLEEQADTGTYWIALCCKNDEIVYFDSFGVEHVSKGTEKFKNKQYLEYNQTIQ